MQITNRDMRLIAWLNGVGFATVALIAHWLSVDFSTAARLVRRLVDVGLLRRRRVSFLNVAVLVPTPAACRLLGDPLPPIRNVSFATFGHSLLLGELSIGLERRFQGSFEPERRIRHRSGKANHMVDGILQVPDKGPIGIELELSAKGRRRLQQIIEEHAANFDFVEVWYVVTDDVTFSYLKSFTADHPHIRVARWRPKIRTLSRGTNSNE